MISQSVCSICYLIPQSQQAISRGHVAITSWQFAFGGQADWVTHFNMEVHIDKNWTGRQRRHSVATNTLLPEILFKDRPHSKRPRNSVGNIRYRHESANRQVKIKVRVSVDCIYLQMTYAWEKEVSVKENFEID